MNELPLVSIDARSSNWREPPWPSAFELARLLPRSSWTLVGGLMVKLHAELAGLPAPRTTVDVDSALHLETQAITFAKAAPLGCREFLGSLARKILDSSGISLFNWHFDSQVGRYFWASVSYLLA